uniref:Uncharacterized protein n=1 Tax=viral metagenome TaxID=1070528 RepID=A0A6M3LUJ2_9ZZZZ
MIKVHTTRILNIHISGTHIQIFKNLLKAAYAEMSVLHENNRFSPNEEKDISTMIRDIRSHL